MENLSIACKLQILAIVFLVVVESTKSVQSITTKNSSSEMQNKFHLHVNSNLQLPPKKIQFVVVFKTQFLSNCVLLSVLCFLYFDSGQLKWLHGYFLVDWLIDEFLYFGGFYAFRPGHLTVILNCAKKYHCKDFCWPLRQLPTNTFDWRHL